MYCGSSHLSTPTALTGAFDLAEDIDDFRVTMVAGQRYLYRQWQQHPSLPGPGAV